MKTAEDWAKDTAYIMGRTPSGMMKQMFSGEEVQWIKIIQLDAMKEGMRRAAALAAYASSCHDLPIIDEFRLEKKQAILTAAEQLTEKDL